MKKSSKILIIIITLIFIQTGITAFALVSNSTEKNNVEQDEVLANFLTDFNVHEQYALEIDRLIKKGYPLSDILIGYEFLYQSFGLISELEPLVEMKSTGISWENVLIQYNGSHDTFVPRTFDSAYLETLMNTPSLTADDIMIADHVSFATGKPIESIITAKMGTEHWKPITVAEGVLYSADSIPRVQITMEQLEMYIGTGLSEQQVVDAFVIAHKLEVDPSTVIDMLQENATIEAIMANAYTNKYQ